MDRQQDQAVMERWQALGRKQNPDFDVYDDFNHAFLFAHFQPEDHAEAWSLIPEHKEIQSRIEELEKGSASEDERGGGVPAYYLPSKKNVLPNDRVIELLKQHFKNAQEAIDVEEYPEAHEFLIRKLTFEHHPMAGDAEPDKDKALDETFSSAFDDTAFDAIPGFDCYYALYEYVVYMTKWPDVTNYILTPCLKSPRIKSDTFEPGFKLYLAGIDFWIKDEQTVQFCQRL